MEEDLLDRIRRLADLQGLAGPKPPGDVRCRHDPARRDQDALAVDDAPVVEDVAEPLDITPAEVEVGRLVAVVPDDDGRSAGNKGRSDDQHRGEKERFRVHSRTFIEGKGFVVIL